MEVEWLEKELKVNKRWREVAINKRGEQNVNITYFVHEAADIRNLFLLLEVNNMVVEEGNKLHSEVTLLLLDCFCILYGCYYLIFTHVSVLKQLRFNLVHFSFWVKKLISRDRVVGIRMSLCALSAKFGCRGGGVYSGVESTFCRIKITRFYFILFILPLMLAITEQILFTIKNNNKVLTDVKHPS